MSEQSSVDTDRCCPDRGSESIYNEDGHGDTICQDCGWYTEQGGPSENVNWRSVGTDSEQEGER